MTWMQWVLLSALLVCWVAAVVGLWWSGRVLYGPLVAGNARWRREAPLREARARERELHQALTAEDVQWLQERGWET